MPPSASAMPPTHTTQRVPKRSSKPMSRVGSVTGRAIEPGESELGTDAAAGCGDGEGGGGTGSVVMLGAGAGAAGCAFSGSGEGRGDGAAGLSSSDAILNSRRRRLSLIPDVLTSAIMARTGVASSKTTSRTMNPTIEPPGVKSVRGVYAAVVTGESLSSCLWSSVTAPCLFEVELEWLGFHGHDAAANIFDRRDHAPLAAEQFVGQRDDTDIRRCRRRRAAQRLRDAGFVAMRIERADAGKGARRRTADAHVTMHHEWRFAVPAAHEIQKRRDMLLARHDVALEWGGNVVQAEPKMMFRRYACRPLQACLIADQRHHMARAGIFDGLLQARKRADVDHGFFLFLRRLEAAPQRPKRTG